MAMHPYSRARWGGLSGVAALVLAACSATTATPGTPQATIAPPSTAPVSAAATASMQTTTPPPASPSTLPSGSLAPASMAPMPSASAAGSVDMTALVAAAKAEGTLNVIALPRDWCNYGAVLDGFKAKYGLTINSINPSGGSGDELQAIVANKGNTGPQAPDVIDVGVSFGPQAVEQGLLQPYKVSTWPSIDPASKDPNGYWYGDYFGVLTFEVNSDVAKSVPHDWSDLLGPSFKNSVALAGDPTTSNQAIQSVYAAALASGGSLSNAQKGLAFFKQLNDAGNFVPVIANAGTLAHGETPVVITWSYLALANRDNLAGNPKVEVVVPASGRFAGLYAQGISAYAPHPNAAKLWEEYLYSDEGQMGWLKGYCSTTRYADMVTRHVVPAELAAKLPDVTGAVFPDAAQLTAAKTLITAGWKKEIGVTVAPAPTP